VNARELLEAARELVRDRFTQGAFARDAWGAKVAPESPAAVVFDPLGAVLAAAARAKGDQRATISHAVSALQASCGSPHGFVTEWADAPRRTHAEILRAFDRAIELAAERERRSA